MADKLDMEKEFRKAEAKRKQQDEEILCRRKAPNEVLVKSYTVSKLEPLF